MKMKIDDQHPVLDMDVSLSLKVKDLMKLNTALSRTYDEEEGMRETLSPILQEIRMVINEIESNPEWATLRKWDCGDELMAKAADKQKKHLKRIKEAMMKDRHLRLSYCAAGAGQITKRTVIPLDLWENGDMWLLRAYCYLEGEEHTFRVERILKLKDKAPGKKSRRPAALQREAAASDAVVTGMEEDAEPAPDSDQVMVADFDDYIAETGIPEQPEETGDPSPSETAEAAPQDKDPEESPKDSHGTETGHGAKNVHYSLPGKNPHQPGLPNRLDRLIKRVEHKDH